MEPMTLSSRQEDDFCSRPFVDLGPEFPFPEDLLPKHAKVDSKVPFMTLVSCFCDWLRSGVLVFAFSSSEDMSMTKE